MDKIDRLFDAMEHPERYSAAEIESLLSDPEVKEVFDVLDKTKSSMQHVPHPDVEDEWKTFVAKRIAGEPSPRYTEKVARRFRFADLFSRKAAASIAIGIASLTAVAAIVGISVRYIERKKDVDTVPGLAETEVKVINAQPDSTLAVVEVSPASVETVVFDNEPFETIISQIADYYGYEVIFDSDNSKALRLYFRWNQALPAEEVAGSLNNFEQINLTVTGKTIRID